MIAWKILGWVALGVVVVSIAVVSLAGFALYSTGREAVEAVERVAAPAPASAAGPVHDGRTGRVLAAWDGPVWVCPQIDGGPIRVNTPCSTIP